MRKKKKTHQDPHAQAQEIAQVAASLEKKSHSIIWGGAMTVQRFYTRWAAVLAVLIWGYFGAGKFVFSAAGPVVDVRAKALAHYIMGVSADLNGMAAESVKEYEQSAALNSQEPLPHLRLAAYYARLGLLDKAVAQLKTVVRLDPKGPQARFLLAMVYFSAY